MSKGFDDGGPAFPREQITYKGEGDPHILEYPGMSRWDFFFGCALIGITTNAELSRYSWEATATMAEEGADAMIALVRRREAEA